MKDFLAQNILNSNHAETGNYSVQNSSDDSIDFVKGSKKLFTRFNGACIQTIDEITALSKFLFSATWILNSFMVPAETKETLKLKN